jgi:hypothetical protein
MTVAEEKPAACCGQTGTRSVLWMHTLDDEAMRAVVAEDSVDDARVPLSFWASRPEHAAPPATPMHRVVLDTAFNGRGLRVIVEGCNRRWPRARPTAVLVCAECGRGRTLGNPPRGWASGRKRWYVWFHDQGVTIEGYLTSATVYDGIGAFRAALDPYAP